MDNTTLPEPPENNTPNNSDDNPNQPTPQNNAPSNKINPFLLLFLIFPLLGIVAALLTSRPTGGAGPLEPPPAYFTPTTRIGVLAPDFSLKTPAGKSVRLSDLRGQWVFLNFWATWCPPCRSEMPTFQKFLDGGFGIYNGKATVLAVDRVEDAAQINAYLKELGLSVPVAMDEDAKITNLYGILNLPVTFVVDPSGIVRYEQIGEMTPALLKKYLDEVGTPMMEF